MVTRHNLCFSHRVYDYVYALCCAECLRWPEEVITSPACYNTSASKASSQSSVLPPASTMSLCNPRLSDFSFLMLPIYDAYSISSVCF